jgi:hypothetical protein
MAGGTRPAIKMQVLLRLPNAWIYCTITSSFEPNPEKLMPFARFYFYFYFSYSSPTAVEKR